MNPALYQAIDVYKRIDENTLARYRCFRLLPDAGYCVQSVDFLRAPFDEAQLRQLDHQFLELLVEELPSVRAPLFATLEAAITAHDAGADD